MKEEKLLQHDPLADAERILRDDFYGRGSPPQDDDEPAPAAGARRRKRATTPRPTHYKVICISMYTRDLEELEAKVGELKRRGWTKANKSHLIRLALSQLDLDRLPTPRQ
ncbi:MAG TPA: hypothetical protein VHE35_08820 [Kofleriaceae bacterium]|nr:hypothetical protein [Kofleriaceae bacterium]